MSHAFTLYGTAHLLNEITKTCHISLSTHMLLQTESWSCRRTVFYPTLHRYPINLRCCHSDKKARNPAARERAEFSGILHTWSCIFIQAFLLADAAFTLTCRTSRCDFCAYIDLDFTEIICGGPLYHSRLLYTHICSYSGSWPGKEDDHII